MRAPFRGAPPQHPAHPKPRPGPFFSFNQLRRLHAPVESTWLALVPHAGDPTPGMARRRPPRARLDTARRTALLESFARSPVLLFRRGTWGLRTLIMLGWYTQPSVIAGLGYRAHPSGWDARR